MAHHSGPAPASAAAGGSTTASSHASGSGTLLQAPAAARPGSKSPPKIRVPAPDEIMDDHILFSPGVDTPGHRLDASPQFQDDHSKAAAEEAFVDSPAPKRKLSGCLPCIKRR